MGDAVLESRHKDRIAVFVRKRSQNDIVFADFAAFEAMKHLVCNVSRSVGDRSFPIFYTDLFSELAFLAELFLNEG